MFCDRPIYTLTCFAVTLTLSIVFAKRFTDVQIFMFFLAMALTAGRQILAAALVILCIVLMGVLSLYFFALR